MALWLRSAAATRRPLGLRPRAKNVLRWDLTRPLAVECLESRWLLSTNPIISEFVASNGTGLQDDAGNYPDWLEICNPDSQTAVLQRAGFERRRIGAFSCNQFFPQPQERQK